MFWKSKKQQNVHTLNGKMGQRKDIKDRNKGRKQRIQHKHNFRK